MYGLDFFSFNIVGLSSPLLPCRLVDLRRGLLYSKNLQHPSLTPFPLNRVRATLPPSTLFADRALLHRGYSISEPNALVETVSKYKGLH